MMLRGFRIINIRTIVLNENQFDLVTSLRKGFGNADGKRQKGSVKPWKIGLFFFANFVRYVTGFV